MSEIQFTNVSKQFPNAPRPAVNNCSFVVENGSFVVILGPSGCGKTTLMKMVNRLYEPTDGKIAIDGKDILSLDATELRRQIGYVIQQIGLFPHMTVAENVSIVPTLLGWSQERMGKVVDELLTLVELPPEEYRHRYPSQMSGGQQQRVGVARALAGDPSVILMDEPFGAIDAITRTTLQDAFLKLQKQLKKTILFVTHDVEEALRLADKIVIMQSGHIVQYDTPFAILSQPANDFVRELVGADDIIRQLSLIRVTSEMRPLPVNFQLTTQPTLSADEDLREALSLMLKTGVEELVVVSDEKPMGIVSFDHIQQSAQVT